MLGIMFADKLCWFDFNSERSCKEAIKQSLKGNESSDRMWLNCIALTWSFVLVRVTLCALHLSTFESSSSWLVLNDYNSAAHNIEIDPHWCHARPASKGSFIESSPLYTITYFVYVGGDLTWLQILIQVCRGNLFTQLSVFDLNAVCRGFGGEKTFSLRMCAFDVCTNVTFVALFSYDTLEWDWIGWTAA